MCLEVVTSRLAGFEGRRDKRSRGPKGNRLATACQDVLFPGTALPRTLCWHEPGEARSRIRISSPGTTPLVCNHRLGK